MENISDEENSMFLDAIGWSVVSNTDEKAFYLTYHPEKDAYMDTYGYAGVTLLIPWAILKEYRESKGQPFNVEDDVVDAPWLDALNELGLEMALRMDNIQRDLRRKLGLPPDPPLPPAQPPESAFEKKMRELGMTTTTTSTGSTDNLGTIQKAQVKYAKDSQHQSHIRQALGLKANDPIPLGVTTEYDIQRMGWTIRGQDGAELSFRPDYISQMSGVVEVDASPFPPEKKPRFNRVKKTPKP